MSEHLWPKRTLGDLVEALRQVDGSRPTIRVHPGSPTLPGLGGVARDLADSTGGLLSAGGAEQEPGEFPGVEILDRDGRAVALWSAMPTGPEAAPFLGFLTLLCQADRGKGCAHSPPVTVLIAPECSNCPNAVRASAELVARGLVSHLHVVDITAFPREVERYGIASVPVTICDDLVLTGVRSSGELAGTLESWGTAAWTERVLAAHLEESRVERAASLLVDGSGLAAFAALWKRSSLATRLGLMLAAQTALERAPGALDGAVASLLPLVHSEDPPLRGDTVELLGWIGHPSAIPALRPLTDDPDPEVAAAAAEALQELQQGS